MCPIAQKVTITQNTQVKYQHSWTDNNDFTEANVAAPGPTRTVLPGAALSQRNVAPLGAGSDATLEIEFNEQVVSPGSGIQVDVGGQTLTGGTRLRPAPDGLPEKWTFTMSSAFLQSLPNATNTITINATNRFASNLAIDGDPSSMAFRGYDGTLTGCDAATTPGAPSGDTLASFPTKALPFVVGEAVSAVRGQARVFGLKLASERLHGIQARAIPRRGEPLHGIRMPGQVFEARKVMSQPSVRIGDDSNQRLAKPSVYRPKGGKPTVCSLAGRFINAGSGGGRLAGYEPSSLVPVVGARPHRAPPSFRTVINLPGVAVVLRRAPPPLALQNLGKAGKKDRGGCNG
jgi:hypothetical protein